ncbi:hypothetical protein F511_02625 [Dorcoceras hygrometricum]|uniref:Mitochondrial glycoprotein family protein n=1 Tax=Dorcoceras hygrometricum TaxID=472368 RepID=A0A2Z7AMJ1_9LAMI|nr:hypothetical protein F511_02625 [Dorcoceras hygrometricum]
MARRLIEGLRGAANSVGLHQKSRPNGSFSRIITRNYMSEMEKATFEGKILRLIRNEVQYELDRSPPSPPIPEFDAFKVEEIPGEQWIRLTRKFGASEEIKIEVTMFDGSLPTKKRDDDAEDDVQLHITFVVELLKEENKDVMQFVCSAWPDSIEIRKVFTHGLDQIKVHPYAGPRFKELDDELQDSLYDFLEARGINDDLAVFLHQYIMNKDKTEYIRWLEKVKSFVHNSKN